MGKSIKTKYISDCQRHAVGEEEGRKGRKQRAAVNDVRFPSGDVKVP